VSAAPATTVEFLGLPGAGKSTVAAALVRAATAAGHRAMVVTARYDERRSPVARRTAKMRMVAAEVVGRPWPTLRAVGAIRRSGSEGVAADVRRSVAWLLAQRLLSNRAAHDGLTVLDEGPLQALWSLGLFGDHTTLLEAWRARPESWATADVVVVMLPSIPTVLSRLGDRRRAHSRVERLPRDARRQALQRGEIVLRDIADALPDIRRRQPHVVLLDGEGRVDDMVRTILARLPDPPEHATPRECLDRSETGVGTVLDGAAPTSPG
jgi:thymidylate kinase